LEAFKNPMTKIERLRAVCEKATAGPWVNSGSEVNMDETCIAVTLYRSNEEEENARFIALARTALPQLLDLVERQNEAIQSLYGTCKILGNGFCQNDKVDEALTAYEKFNKCTES